MIVPARLVRFLALVFLSSCLMGAAAGADQRDEIAKAVDRAFQPLLKEHDVPGIAVAVTAGGQQHFFNYGVAAKDTKAPVTKDTLFEIGSISKTFTATLASYAQALGKLSLDDHPRKYMPQLSGSAVDEATLLHLGTYTAGGLPLQFPEGITNTAEMTAYFRQWKAGAAPGAQRRYSNPSIGLFGHLTGIAMNGNFARLIETDIFPALGLGSSYIRVPEAAMGNYAWGYNKAGKPIRVSRAVLDAEAYGVKSTAADMIRYVEGNIQPDRLEPAMKQAVEGTHVAYFKVGEMAQGLGWEQYPYPITLERLLAGNSSSMIMEPNAATPLKPPHRPTEPTLFNKTGSTNGFGAYVAFVPAKKIGIVMLANRNFPIPARVTAAHAVLEALSKMP
ncbi:beta-lactamase [Agaricicola taiwanensis]|uniref:Beta-lactamase n=1 Tax=Agaricicola taiwanensis TaxID=591372 RepID=A0A8J2VFN5_9RHOB|nr:class C beta-lactamase [Agaricicola taiwanensis]GGE29733.1 beta-lactamase [Agaricicola taiwanensis]